MAAKKAYKAKVLENFDTNFLKYTQYWSDS